VTIIARLSSELLWAMADDEIRAFKRAHERGQIRSSVS
jgi:hypothetical protein